MLPLRALPETVDSPWNPAGNTCSASCHSLRSRPAAHPNHRPVAPPAAAAAAAPAQVIDIAGMDRSVAPGDDFNAYASGTWLANNEIPADRNAYGTTGILVDLTRERVSEIVKGTRRLEEHASRRERQGARLLHRLHGRGPASKQRDCSRSRRTWRASTDSPTRRRSRAEIGAGLRADVDMLNATAMHTDNLFGLWVAQDLDDPARYATFLVQGGLTMLDRAYYVDNSPRMVEIRAKIPGARCECPAARGHRRRDGGGQAHRRARNGHCPGALEARGQHQRGARQQSLEAHGVRAPRARARLGGALHRGTPRRPRGARRLASRRQ